MSQLIQRSMKALLQSFINYHLDLRKAEKGTSAYEIYDDYLEAIAGELNRRIYQLTQPAKPDDWFHVGHVIFNAAMVELVTGDAEACSIHYQGFSHDFEGEEAAVVWQWFSDKTAQTVARAEGGES